MSSIDCHRRAGKRNDWIWGPCFSQAHPSSPLLLATLSWADSHISQVNVANLERQPGTRHLRPDELADA